MSDIRFYFDPACPFAWMTSTWVRTVREQREYDVEWRFISLKHVNREKNYDTDFPPEYVAGHTSGSRLLRVAAAAREAHGNDGVDRLYAALGDHIWNVEGGVDWTQEVERLDEWVTPVLEAAGLPTSLASAVSEERFDALIAKESDEALELTGKDVGTPIIHFEPDAEDGGVAFFGPVISRRPDAEQAVELWDHVVGLARFPGFAELKRSLRETPQLKAMGVEDAQVGVQEDWQGGRRRPQDAA